MPRNPRRAYEKDGTEIPPMTLANMRENGTGSIEATCTECQHETTLWTHASAAGLTAAHPEPS